ncbi:MAG: 30S ribosomal protein S15 [Chlamydiia bacterium]|nr:30S ribosomal protein S15 [Chlamydiia bacterium]
MSKQEKRSNVIDVKLHKRDTGSADVQIVVITQRIHILRNKYIESNRQDPRHRRDLLVFLNKRQGLIDYLKVTDTARYQRIVEVLKVSWL